MGFCWVLFSKTLIAKRILDADEAENFLSSLSGVATRVIYKLHEENAKLRQEIMKLQEDSKTDSEFML